MSTSKTSPSWKRPLSERLRASLGTNPLPPPQTLPSQLPTADQQIRLNLEDTTLVFDNGRWITDSAGGGDNVGLQQEIRELKNQLRQANQEKNLLEFKNELLLDMLTLNSLELKRLKDTIDQQVPARLKQK